MTEEQVSKPKPLEPQLLALQGQLASFKLSDQQVRAIAAYTHPRSKGRGKAKPAALLAGYSAGYAKKDAPTWFRKPEIVRAVNIAVTYWTETLEASTSMDHINDRLFFVSMFDTTTLYRKDKEGVTRLKDLTTIDGRAIHKIHVERTTTTDPKTGLHTTKEKLDVEPYNFLHAARLFSHIKGALRDNRVGNTETPHRLTLTLGRGQKVTIEADKAIEVPGEILDVTPNGAGTVPAPLAPAAESGSAGNDREEV